MVQSTRRLPRSLQQEFDLVVATVLSRLNADPNDTAGHNIMFLIPRIILRRDPAKGDTAHNNSRTDYLNHLREHAEAMPAGDCLKMRIERFKNGDWECLFDDYLRAADVQRRHRASLGDGRSSDAALRMHAFQKADRLVGSNELSRGANAIINTSRAEKDASFSAGCLRAKHGIEGGLTEEEAIELNVLLADPGAPALQIDEDSWNWALTHISRGAAPGPSGWSLELWKDVCADANISTSLRAFVNAAFCKDQLPLPLTELWGACNTVGLTKKLGGLRPISMGDTLRRLTGKAAIRQLREKAAGHLKPYQWGVSTSRGCATIAHTARDYLRRHPDHVLLKLDISNAFNSQSRGSFLSAVAIHFPELLPLAAQFYRVPTTLYIRGKDATCTILSVSGQQQGDTMGPLLFALGLQPALEAVHAKHKGVIIRAYIDDIHILGPDSDVAAAFLMLKGLLAEQNLQVSFGAAKTSAWSPAWETDPSRASTSAVLGPLLETTERIHMCTGGIATLGTFIGTDSFVMAEAVARVRMLATEEHAAPADSDSEAAEPDEARVEDDFKHACDSLVSFSRFKAGSAVHSANVLLNRCIVPKISYMLELLPPHLVAEAAVAAHALVVSTYCAINDISAEEAAFAFDRLVLPPSLKGCGLRYYPDISPAAYITSRLHTVAAVATAIAEAEAAQASAAAEAASDTSSSDDGAPRPVGRARAAAESTAAPLTAATTTLPTTSALEDVTAGITAVLETLPDIARCELDPSATGSDDLKEHNHLQRKLTRKIELDRACKVNAAADAAVAAAVAGSEEFCAAQRNIAHLNSCDGTWILAPALSYMRISCSYYRTYARRYLRLPLPICNFGDGVGTSRPPRNFTTGVHKIHDVFGDFLLSVFHAAGQSQWNELHEEIKNFFYRAAKQAGITSVTREKRADLSGSRRRPGDVKIGSTRHGWRAAVGKTLLIDVTTISAVCATWVAKCAAAVGGGGKGAAADKTTDVLASGEPSENQYFQALGFESEGHIPKEAKQMLHAWAKIYAESRGLSKADMNFMLQKWLSELAFIRAKFTAKCLVERAAFCAEKQDNIDGIMIDARPPMPHQLHAFATH
jgi:hypothetical protein